MYTNLSGSPSGFPNETLRWLCWKLPRGCALRNAPQPGTTPAVAGCQRPGRRCHTLVSWNSLHVPVLYHTVCREHCLDCFAQGISVAIQALLSVNFQRSDIMHKLYLESFLSHPSLLFIQWIVSFIKNVISEVKPDWIIPEYYNQKQLSCKTFWF